MNSNADTGSNQYRVLVEVLTASGCGHCQQTRSLAKVVIAELADERIHYREINVVEAIDYAVQLGMLATPAIALNGELVFASSPSKAVLRQAILARLAEFSALQSKEY